jgi:DNA-binding transcriptional LysR family regulator
MIDEPEYKYLSLRNQSSTVALQQLRYAVISAECGSFRRAAEALLMRQSTLSHCIRQLEESIGVTVFERSSGGVCTTTAGRNFLRTARSILEQMDALVTSARSGSAVDFRLDNRFVSRPYGAERRRQLVEERPQQDVEQR